MDEVNRTLAIVKLLSEGDILKLKDNSEIGMAENMKIGYIFNGGISDMASMTLEDLNNILNKENIGYSMS